MVTKKRLLWSLYAKPPSLRCHAGKFRANADQILAAGFPVGLVTWFVLRLAATRVLFYNFGEASPHDRPLVSRLIFAAPSLDYGFIAHGSICVSYEASRLMLEE
jgi:hypothetical protein